MPSGILLIDKPADWTSHDVVAKLRGILKERRIGHAGTLDPMATGLLPIFVGRATRAVEFATEGPKEYIAGLRLGLVTNTQDITGEVLARQAVTIDAATLEQALATLRGDILQIPPMFSAIKKQGKKLYELARAGKEVERAPRPVSIYELTILEQTAPSDFILRVRCSKGTYVRTLCHDIGAYLGTGGCLSSLRRTEAAGFHVAQAHSLKTLQESETPQRFLLPVDDCFADSPALVLDAVGERKIRNGSDFPHEAPNGLYRVYNDKQDFLMLGRVEEKRLKTVKSFFEVS